MFLNTYGSPDGVDELRPALGTSAVTAYLPHGTSGASVYDKASGCLVGLISAKDKLAMNDAEVYVTRIVPAADLKPFIEHQRPSVGSQNARLRNGTKRPD